MNHTFRMLDLFGSFLADGDLGNRFRFCEVEPLLISHESIVFDFEGVLNMTDSFCNACFETLATEHASQVRRVIRFQNCSPLIKSFVGNALAVGFETAARNAA
jgi:hypothetical protein